MNIFNKYEKVNADNAKWEGPCGDSFCYASCELPVCNYRFRLGTTPSLHNKEVDKLHKERALAIAKIYDLVPGTELYDDLLNLFRRLMEHAP